MAIQINKVNRNHFYETTRVQENKVTQNQMFADTLTKTSADSVLSELEKRFGTKINVEAIGKSEKDIERCAFKCNGSNHVTIAPNILEEMAVNPALKQRIEQKIQDHFDAIPANEQYLAARGFTMVASGVTVHEDGTVTYWVFQDQTPEEKERIRLLQEAEDKAKAAQRQRFAEAAEKQVILKHSIAVL